MRESLLPRHFLNLAWGSHPRWKKTINIAAHTQFKSWPNPVERSKIQTMYVLLNAKYQADLCNPPQMIHVKTKKTHITRQKKKVLWSPA